MLICNKCGNSFKSKIKIENKWRNLSNRKYCLNCSPLNSHNTRKLHLTSNLDEKEQKKNCPKCNKIKNFSEFYTRCGKRKTKLSGYCKECMKKESLIRQQTLKQKCVDYKGGKCELCNYDKCSAALEFHHRDPAQKDFELRMSRQAFTTIIKNELDKCQLVCANCHREIHQNLLQRI